MYSFLASILIGIGVVLPGVSGSAIAILFGIYDKVLTNEPIKSTDNNEVTNNQEPEINSNNSYELFAKNLKSQFSKYDDNNKNSICVNVNEIGEGYEVYLTKEQTLYVKYYNKELNDKYGEYKIADNVLSFNVVPTGQGGGNMLFFINEDGTVGSADTEYGIGTNNQITVRKDLGYKNIVSVISGVFGNEFTGVRGPIFIDINGNIFSTNLK